MSWQAHEAEDAAGPPPKAACPQFAKEKGQILLDLVKGPAKSAEQPDPAVEARRAQVVGPNEFLEFVTSSRGELFLDIKRRNLSDADLKEGLSPELCKAVHEKLASQPVRGDMWHLNVDASENAFTGDGMKTLVDFLLSLNHQRSAGEKGIYVRTLRVFRNNLGDRGAQQVARLVIAQPSPIHELHLSHSRIGQAGAAAILLSFSQNPVQAYPFRLPPRNVVWGACWIRMEQNDVPDPSSLLKALEDREGVHVISTASRAAAFFGPGRGPAWATSPEEVPQAVLHIFAGQVAGKGYAKGWSRQGSYEDECHIHRVLEDALSELQVLCPGLSASKAKGMERKQLQIDTAMSEAQWQAAHWSSPNKGSSGHFLLGTTPEGAQSSRGPRQDARATPTPVGTPPGGLPGSESRQADQALTRYAMRSPLDAVGPGLLDVEQDECFEPAKQPAKELMPPGSPVWNQRAQSTATTPISKSVPSTSSPLPSPIRPSSSRGEAIHERVQGALQAAHEMQTMPGGSPSRLEASARTSPTAVQSMHFAVPPPPPPPRPVTEEHHRHFDQYTTGFENEQVDQFTKGYGKGFGKEWELHAKGYGKEHFAQYYGKGKTDELEQHTKGWGKERQFEGVGQDELDWQMKGKGKEDLIQRYGKGFGPDYFEQAKGFGQGYVEQAKGTGKEHWMHYYGKGTGKDELDLNGKGKGTGKDELDLKGKGTGKDELDLNGKGKGTGKDEFDLKGKGSGNEQQLAMRFAQKFASILTQDEQELLERGVSYEAVAGMLGKGVRELDFNEHGKGSGKHQHMQPYGKGLGKDDFDWQAKGLGKEQKGKLYSKGLGKDDHDWHPSSYGQEMWYGKGFGKDDFDEQANGYGKNQLVHGKGYGKHEMDWQGKGHGKEPASAQQYGKGFGKDDFDDYGKGNGKGYGKEASNVPQYGKGLGRDDSDEFGKGCGKDQHPWPHAKGFGKDELDWQSKGQGKQQITNFYGKGHGKEDMDGHAKGYGKEASAKGSGKELLEEYLLLGKSKGKHPEHRPHAGKGFGTGQEEEILHVQGTKQEQLRQAMEVIESLDSCGDATVLGNWTRHLEASDDPMKEAFRIMTVLGLLVRQGFCKSSSMGKGKEAVKREAAPSTKVEAPPAKKPSGGGIPIVPMPAPAATAKRSRATTDPQHDKLQEPGPDMTKEAIDMISLLNQLKQAELNPRSPPLQAQAPPRLLNLPIELEEGSSSSAQHAEDAAVPSQLTATSSLKAPHAFNEPVRPGLVGTPVLPVEGMVPPGPVTPQREVADISASGNEHRAPSEDDLSSLMVQDPADASFQ
eukprot:TRINITY_DN7653_c0_g1_i1.p1 TRINITY_DN7653_c0_g1~~TRINITY_DN7653_c0_g1_i1.p1  ORF type:complete len:1304 (-),score=310.30 TRINITY_DN7653_c0_g1_i1:104-4015(-)